MTIGFHLFSLIFIDLRSFSWIRVEFRVSTILNTLGLRKVGTSCPGGNRDMLLLGDFFDRTRIENVCTLRRTMYGAYP